MAQDILPKRRDPKHRILRSGESIRIDGKYQYKYMVNGKAKFVYSWKLEPTDKLPAGKRPCLSLRELEKQIGHDIEQRLDPTKKKMTVMELVEKYLSTKTGMRPNTMANYNFVRNLLTKEEFSGRRIGDVKTSDAKLFLIKLQKDGKGHSTIKTVRGVLRPAFQMAVDDDAEHHASCVPPHLLQHSGAGRHVSEDAAVPDGSQRHRSDDEHVHAPRSGGCA